MKKYLALLLALVMIFALCACGGKGEKAPAEVAGRYYMVSMTEDGTTLTVEEYSAIYGVEYERYIDLRRDGTAFMYEQEDGYTEEVDLAWRDGKIWSVEYPSDVANFTISGNTLTISQDSTKMIFKKG